MTGNDAQRRSNVLTLRRHTAGHVGCERSELSRLQALSPKELANTEFCKAAEIWLKAHSLYISEETRADYVKCIRALTSFFAGMILATIHIGNIREYQEERKRIQ